MDGLYCPQIPAQSNQLLFSIKSSSLSSLRLNSAQTHSPSLSFVASSYLFSLLSQDGEAKISQESALPNGTGEAVNEASRPKILHVVLVSPQIPGNTGAIARTCAAAAVGLHLVAHGEKRLLAFTKRGTKVHSDFSYRKGDYLLFGSETSGLPPEALQDCNSEPHGGGTIRIPIVES